MDTGRLARVSLRIATIAILAFIYAPILLIFILRLFPQL